MLSAGTNFVEPRWNSPDGLARQGRAMPSMKLRDSKILCEYGGAQSELIGKAVVLTARPARSRTFGWMNCTGSGFSTEGHDGRWPVSTIKLAEPSLDLASAARCLDRALLSEHSDPNEKPDLGQESDAHDRDRKEHVSC